MAVWDVPGGNTRAGEVYLDELARRRQQMLAAASLRLRQQASLRASASASNQRKFSGSAAIQRAHMRDVEQARADAAQAELANARLAEKAREFNAGQRSRKQELANAAKERAAETARLQGNADRSFNARQQDREQARSTALRGSLSKILLGQKDAELAKLVQERAPLVDLATRQPLTTDQMQRINEIDSQIERIGKDKADIARYAALGMGAFGSEGGQTEAAATPTGVSQPNPAQVSDSTEIAPSAQNAQAQGPPQAIGEAAFGPPGPKPAPVALPEAPPPFPMEGDLTEVPVPEPPQAKSPRTQAALANARARRSAAEKKQAKRDALEAAAERRRNERLQLERDRLEEMKKRGAQAKKIAALEERIRRKEEEDRIAKKLGGVVAKRVKLVGLQTTNLPPTVALKRAAAAGLPREVVGEVLKRNKTYKAANDFTADLVLRGLPLDQQIARLQEKIAALSGPSLQAQGAREALFKKKIAAPEYAAYLQQALKEKLEQLQKLKQTQQPAQ